MKFSSIILLTICLSASPVHSQASGYDSDTYSTPSGDLRITFIGHASLLMEFDGKTIHIDPYSRVGDYEKLPTADMIVITHHHGDHLDPELIKKLRKPGAPVIAPELCCMKIDACTLMKNGDSRTVLGLDIEAVPAYNIVQMRPDGNPYHVKGEGNGYIITFAGKRVYIAGDTENIPEMRSFANIDIAFLPMNIPYTMTEEMAADAAKIFRPAVLYPYHYRGSDTEKLTRLLKEETGIKVLIRDLYKAMKKD